MGTKSEVDRWFLNSSRDPGKLDFVTSFTAHFFETLVVVVLRKRRRISGGRDALRVLNLCGHLPEPPPELVNVVERTQLAHFINLVMVVAVADELHSQSITAILPLSGRRTRGRPSQT
ncbi:hypothetical protein PS1_033143 [Malus domestica]